MTHKSRKKFHVLKSWMVSFFSALIFCSAVIFFQFLVIKALDPNWIRIGSGPYWIRIGIQPKMLDPDPDEINADPQTCFLSQGLEDFPPLSLADFSAATVRKYCLTLTFLGVSSSTTFSSASSSSTSSLCFSMRSWVGESVKPKMLVSEREIKR